MKRSMQGGSTKGERRENRKPAARKFNALPSDHLLSSHLTAAPTRPSNAPLEALTDAQGALINAIEVYDLIFATGEFGTGKTYVPSAMAADAMLAKEITKIYITRPNVGCDEDYGFLPGDLNEKVAPWAQPVIDVLNERMGAGHVEYLLKVGKIEIAPLGMLRGRTFKDCFVILDEAQNTTPKQMKLFLSRIGERCTMVVDGDLEQCDLPAGSPSGLVDGMNKMIGHAWVGHIHFGVDDIVGSGNARDVCLAYSSKRETRPVHHPASPTGAILTSRVH